MGLKKTTMAMALFFIIIWMRVVEGSWQGPQEVVSGQWGSGEGEFGIKRGDTIAYDMFPGDFVVLGTGEIVIRDGQNRRVKVYDGTGALKKIVPYYVGRSYTELTTAPMYGFTGQLEGVMPNGVVWASRYGVRKDDPDFMIYVSFSPLGAVLSTSTTRPPELGVVTQKLLGLEADRKTRRYEVTIAYPDKTWMLITSTSVKGGAVTPVRDAQGNLNVIFNYTKRVRRYDATGNIVGELVMPKNVSGAVEVVGLERLSTVGIQYGPPVIGSDGCVYCWSRTPTQYKILKWTWQ